MASNLGSVEIKRSKLKLVFMMLVSLAFVLLNIRAITIGAESLRLGEFSIYFWWVGLAFFGLLTLFSLHALFFSRAGFVRFSPTGFLDPRHCKREILWSEFSGVVEWSHKGTTLLVCKISDTVDTASALTGFGKFSFALNRPFGLSGIYINAVDLKISYRELRQLTIDYFSQYNPAALGALK